MNNKKNMFKKNYFSVPCSVQHGNCDQGSERAEMKYFYKRIETK